MFDYPNGSSLLLISVYRVNRIKIDLGIAIDAIYFCSEHHIHQT